MMSRFLTLASTRSPWLISASTLALLAAFAGRASPAVAAEAPVVVFEELIVTAQKRDVTLQQTNIAAAGLTSDELERKSVQQLQDLQNAMPSLSVIDQGFTKSVNIRGIGLNLVSPNVAPGVATYKDGVYLPTQTTLAAPFYDIQDVQVLRGPQGTFIGQSATGGAVFINSVSPKLNGERNGYIKGQLGNYDAIGLEGATNIPLSDTAAARVAFAYVRRDSYFTNINPTNQEQPGNIDSLSVRLSLRYQPSDELTVEIKNEYTRDSTDGYAFKPIPGTSFGALAPADPYEINVNADQFNKEIYDLFALKLDYGLPGGVKIRSTTGFQYNDQNTLYDNDGAPVPIVTFQNHYYERIYTQDLGIVSPDDVRFRWVVGGTYFNYRDKVRINLNTPAGLTFISIQQDKSAYGVFASGTYDIVPGLELEAGVRYSLDSQDGVQIQLINRPGLPVARVDLRTPRFKDNVWSGKVALNWKPNTDNLVYAFVARGYKPGGSSYDQTMFQAEVVYDYEVGWKSTLFDRHVRTQVGAFYMDYDKYQLSTFSPASGTSVLRNAPAASTIKGVEAQAQIVFGRAAADFAAAYIDSDVGDLPPQVDTRSVPGGVTGLGPQCTPSGAPPAGQPRCFNYTPFVRDPPGGRNIYSPKVTLSAGFQYSFSLGGEGTLTPRVDISYTGSQWATYFRLPVDELESRTLVNALVTYEQGSWTLQGYATNIFEDSYVSGYLQSSNLTYGRPREFGVRLTRTF